MGRLFILGAGSSVYAGFPLGKDLWDFLVDHCGPLGGAMETVSAYLSTLDADRRLEATRDLELTLTNLETGSIKPMPAGDLYRSNGRRWDLAEKQALRAKLRHTLQNEPRFNYNDYWDSQRIRRSSPVTAWRTRVQLHSLKDLIGDFVAAFLLHHACIRFGRRHFHGTGEPWPADNQRSFRHRCPCRQGLKIGKVHDVFAAIGRHFRPGDTVVTFNYDVTVEASLWGRSLWHFADGYGFPVAIETPRLKRYSRLRRPSPVTVLKPHGSVNWVKSNRDGAIGSSYLGLLFGLPAFSTYLSELDPEEGWETRHTEDTLLAPTYMKDYSSDPTLSLIWDRIETAVATATEISVVGYSLPKGDKAARDRLRGALRKNSARRAVTIVSPGERERSEWPAFLDAAGKRLDWRTGTFDAWIGEGGR